MEVINIFQQYAAIIETSKLLDIQPIPTPLDESLKAKKDFENMFNGFIYRYSSSEVFSDFLDYCLLAFRWWDEKRDFSYYEKKYEKEYPKLLEMLTLLSIASENGGAGFYDALGDLFMDLISHGRNGQFFTPDNLSKMMSTITNSKSGTGAVLDPTCGSGRLLLSSAGENRDAKYFGCDNDITCCKMATLNFLLNTVDGEIAWMDSLSMEYYRSWRTSYKTILGKNLPYYQEITNKENSLLWQIHLNSLNNHAAGLEKDVPAEPVVPILDEIPTPINTQRKKSNNQIDELQLKLF